MPLYELAFYIGNNHRLIYGYGTDMTDTLFIGLTDREGIFLLSNIRAHLTKPQAEFSDDCLLYRKSTV